MYYSIKPYGFPNSTSLTSIFHRFQIISMLTFVPSVRLPVHPSPAQISLKKLCGVKQSIMGFKTRMCAHVLNCQSSFLCHLARLNRHSIFYYRSQYSNNSTSLPLNTLAAAVDPRRVTAHCLCDGHAVY
jgi:hypothetical protein